MGYAVVAKIYGTGLIAESAIRAPVIADVRQIRRAVAAIAVSTGSSTHCITAVESWSISSLYCISALHCALNITMMQDWLIGG